MIKKILLAALITTSLTGCVVGDPAPYYGGAAPYYGTSYAPAYVGIYGDGGYYHHYGYHNIHSGYNNGYWHYQRGAAGRPAAAGFHGGGAPHGGGGGHEGGGHGGR